MRGAGYTRSQMIAFNHGYDIGFEDGRNEQFNVIDKLKGEKMTGCTKTGVKNAIEAIGQYLIDNSEKIAGNFDGMIDFNLEVNFKTDSYEVSWPEIKFANHHYLPFTQELSEKIFNAKEDKND